MARSDEDRLPFLGTWAAACPDTVIMPLFSPVFRNTATFL